MSLLDTVEGSKRREGIHSVLTDLKSCSMRRDLQWGRIVHVKAMESGHDSNMYVVSALIKMYTKCGSMVDARCVFDSIENPDVVSWNALMLGYVENGEGLITLTLFSKMKAHGYAHDSVTYVAALKACTSLARKGDGGQSEYLKRGRQIHYDIGCYFNIFVQNTLVDMYGKCGSMADARRVFDSIQNPDVVSWNALLLGYVENGKGLTTLKLFSKMKAHGYPHDSVTYVAALKACVSLVVKRNGSGQAECSRRGRMIHSEIGCVMTISVQNTLIDMYAKCGCMVDAREVFDSIQKPTLVSWNALLLGYVENGQGLTTLELFWEMKGCRSACDSVTYVAALKACSFLADKRNGGAQGECLRWGRAIHSEVQCHMNIFVQSALIDMYGKCGSMVDARSVFESSQRPNLVCWNTLLLGYAENGYGLTSLNLFSAMKAVGCKPDSVTYMAALKACISLADDGAKAESLTLGRKIHSEIGDLDIFVQNTLIEMYAHCGSMVSARSVFDSNHKRDVVSWNALLLGYVENGEALTAIEMFSRMKAGSSACVPNSVTYIAVLKACGLIGALSLGRKLHSDITEFTSNIVICLVDFYAKCGSMIEALEVFDAHSRARNISTWTALLTGYGSFGDTVSVFNLFEVMQDQGFRPDAVTFVCILSCCSHAGLVEKGKEYFKLMPQYGVIPSLMHYTCMVDVLGRANQLNEAIDVLWKMPSIPDAVIWMTLLGACSKWKNVEIGRYAFQSLVDMGKDSAAAYVFMAHIYGARGMWKEQEKMWKMRMTFGACLGQAYVFDELGNLVKSMLGDRRLKTS